MTITATLVMLIVVTFRIPNAFLAALFSILVARENLIVTWRGARTVVLGFVVASIYILLGMMLFRGYPITHFFWVVGSLYLVFLVMRTTTNYGAAWAFAIPIGISLPVWDRTVPSEMQVEATLWPILIIAIGAGVSAIVEMVYRIFHRSDPLLVFVDDVLLATEQVAESVAGLYATPKGIVDRVLQYQMIGTGRLRVTLLRQGLGPSERAQRGGLIALADRLIGLAAELERSPHPPSSEDAIRLRALGERLGAIRAELRQTGSASAPPASFEGPPSSNLPMLQEMEQVIALIPEVFQRDEFVEGSRRASGGNWWGGLFLPDAFQNSEYRRFAFAGCLAASVCYVLYNALDWPGIFIGVVTCIVTALSTIGNSLQAQFLRLAGFVAGGLIMGISAQVLILPSLDSVFGFALFFAAGTAIAAWFATSSPRLSFFGVQMALAFYFVNLQDSYIQTDLRIARDRVIGVLLGILAMGFIFDRFGTKSDAEQLKNLLVRNVRMLAQLATCPVARNRTTGVSQVVRLRAQINDNFASLESQTDAVRFEFEFRHRRAQDMGECERVQTVQPWLRSIYLMELSLLSHRARQQGLSEEQDQALDRFLSEYSEQLTQVAAWIAGERETPARIGEDSLELFEQRFEGQITVNSKAVDDICRKMVSSFFMLRNEC